MEVRAFISARREHLKDRALSRDEARSQGEK